MKEDNLKGKLALITGAARGIGLAIASRLAAEGADLLAFDQTGANWTDCTAAVQAQGRKISVFEGDVTHSADWELAMAQVDQMWGRLDILVNNAGIGGAVSPLIDYPEAEFDRVLAVNTRGVFLGMRIAAKIMKSRGGCIINIASVSGLNGSKGIIAYTASKHAVIGMTKVAALELAPYQIRVNAVCPAPTNTNMVHELERALSPTNPEAMRQRFIKDIPLRRYGEPSEIASVVAFLASQDSSFITGAALVVDGGMIASL
jgi:NAD(P)-dependent dehydrogenase (short-subunit alcohol dehydrogenase family)